MIARIFLSFCMMFCYLGLQAQQYQDCTNPLPICDMGTFEINSAIGHGLVQDNLRGYNCDGKMTIMETNSYWLSWEAVTDGTISFIIDPRDEKDDVDFVLFRKGESCEEMEPLRCMASGDELGDNNMASLPCRGSTGLSFHSVDEFEKAGCKYNDDNYLKFLSTIAGEKYILLINNFSSSNGFVISFEGSAELKSNNNCDSELHKSSFVLESIYPNPAEDLINIQYSSLLDGISDFQLMDFQGRIVKETKRTTKQGGNLATLNVKNLPPGSYLLRINNESSSSIKQFVKG